MWQWWKWWKWWIGTPNAILGQRRRRIWHVRSGWEAVAMGGKRDDRQWLGPKKTTVEKVDQKVLAVRGWWWCNPNSTGSATASLGCFVFEKVF